MCVSVVQGVSYTVPVVLYRPVSWFGGVFWCSLLGPIDLELDMYVDVYQTPGVFVGFFWCALSISHQKTCKSFIFHSLNQPPLLVIINTTY